MDVDGFGCSIKIKSQRCFSCKLLLRVLLIFIFCATTTTTTTASTTSNATSPTIQGQIPLVRLPSNTLLKYTAYKDVSILHFRIPTDTRTALFNFKAYEETRSAFRKYIHSNPFRFIHPFYQAMNSQSQPTNNEYHRIFHPTNNPIEK